MYEIEKNIPIVGLCGQGKWIKLLKEMDPGDSFLIPTEDMPSNLRSTQSSVNGTACQRGYKIATRSVEGGLRVWLLEKPV